MSPALQRLSREVEFGNAGDVDTGGTGWFIGFGEWTTRGPALRHVVADEALAGLCVKWFSHGAGDPNGEAKPISEGRTVSMLVSPESEFRIEFGLDADFAAEHCTSHTLRRHGDFVVWGPGLFHRAFGVQPACIVTVRWATAEPLR